MVRKRNRGCPQKVVLPTFWDSLFYLIIYFVRVTAANGWVINNPRHYKNA